MAQPQLVINGLDELRAEFRALNRKLPRAIGKAHKRMADRLLPEVQSTTRSLPSPGGSKAKITTSGTQKKASVVFKGGKNGAAIANVLGANRHRVFGRWYPTSVLELHGSRNRVWQPHLGNSWKPEELYGVGPVFKKWRDNFQMDEYRKALTEVLREFK